jgi:glycosyltransferase involved in cell wall biosynthesis
MEAEKTKTKVLYLTYDGILEPLGHSQVLAYLIYLSENFDIHLISFEKKSDLVKKDVLKNTQETLSKHNIRWIRKKYHKNPPLLSTIFDIFSMLLSSIKICCISSPAIVHSRSYVPSVIALVLKKIFSIKFIFDMRGFWADEKIDSNIWKTSSITYKISKWFEKKFLLNADHTISLTRAGIKEISKFNYIKTEFNASVITTCTDLNKFKIFDSEPERKFIIGYVGTAGSWYNFEAAVIAFKIFQEYVPEASFLIVNRGEHEYIKTILLKQNIPHSTYKIIESEPMNLPFLINSMSAGIFFINQSFSKIASAPTKLGEFLACGVPCLTNSRIGDMEDIITKYNVGVTVDNFSDREITLGVQKFLRLIKDKDLKKRARKAGEEEFSLESGCREYAKIYTDLCSDVK